MSLILVCFILLSCQTLTPYKEVKHLIPPLDPEKGRVYFLSQATDLEFTDIMLSKVSSDIENEIGKLSGAYKVFYVDISPGDYECWRGSKNSFRMFHGERKEFTIQASQEIFIELFYRKPRNVMTSYFMILDKDYGRDLLEKQIFYYTGTLLKNN